VKLLVTTRGIDTFTLTALQGIDAMALTLEQGLQVVLSLQRTMFFKSMTTHSDHHVWQDVYHAPCPNDKTAYIKVTIQDGATVIQFKER
jgi:motility quorum-sensing regulator / GCU-specific mRNA interferase toxin